MSLTFCSSYSSKCSGLISKPESRSTKTFRIVVVATFKVDHSPLNTQRKTILRRHKTKRREAPQVSKCELPILGIQLFQIPTHGVLIFAKLDNVVYLSKLLV